MLATTLKGLYKPVRTRLGELPFGLSGDWGSCRTLTRPVRKSDCSSARPTACAPGTHPSVNSVLAWEKGGVSNNSAKRAARGIRFPFADRDLAEQGGVVSEVSAARTPDHGPEVISRQSEQFWTDTLPPRTL